jgi:hypothetical protein
MQDLYKMRYTDTDQLDATAKPKTASTALMIASRKGLLTSVEYLLEVLFLLFL